MLFDANQRLLLTSDTYPHEVQLGKGDYTLRLLLRHDDVQLLEKLKGTCVVVRRKLEEAVAVPVYGTYKDTVTGGDTVGEMFLNFGDRGVVWLGPVPEDKLPKDAAAGKQWCAWPSAFSACYVHRAMLSPAVVAFILLIDCCIPHPCL